MIPIPKKNRFIEGQEYMNDVWIGIISYKYMKCHGIGMKPEYDMKPENKLKHEHEHEHEN